MRTENSIPKVIHYCWFGKGQKSNLIHKCIESWRKYLPEYQIKEWNEDNFNIEGNQYCAEAYMERKWAFVSDYARLWIIYNHGGIYLDTDVEVIKDIALLLENGEGFIGFQNNEEVNSGLGFGAKKGNKCVKKMLELYENRSFYNDDNSLDLTPCPVSNTVALKMMGLKTGKENAKQIQCLEGIKVYPEEYFNPINLESGKKRITSNTYTIHHYTNSWGKNRTRFFKKIKSYLPQCLLEYRSDYISRRDIKIMERQVNIDENG